MTIIKEEVIGDFRITYETLPEYKCLLLTFHGIYDAECSNRVIRDASSFIKELDYNTGLIDFRDACYSMTIAEAYSRADVWESNNVLRTYRLAFVTNANSSMENINFLHKVLANRGWQIHRFTEMGQAQEWLKSV